MKKFLTLAFIFGVTAAAVCADVVSFGDVKLKLYFSRAPFYRAEKGGAGTSGLLDNDQYLVVEATYNPGVADEANVEKARKNKISPATKALHGRWVDNVRMSVLVAYPEVIGKSRKDTIYGLFSGSTTFWTVALDGREHTATMFVPPHLIARYAGFSRRIMRQADGKLAPKGAARYTAKDFFAEVIFTNSKGAELGRAYCYVDGMRNNDDGDLYFRRMEKRAGSRVIRGGVFPRSRTPWAYINPERYDLIRSDGDFIQNK